MQFTAALPDGRHFGAFASATESLESLAALGSAFTQPLMHHR
jgi:hypothetical protein